MLGTELVTNIDPNNLGDPNYGDDKRPEFKARFSKHFRSMWEPAKDTRNVMEGRVDKQLEEGKMFYRIYSDTLGMHMPIVSANKELRGDGVKYRIPIGNNWDGGNWMGWDGARGFGFGIQGPGDFSGHEFGHGCEGHQMRPMAGNFWEVYSNWLPQFCDQPGVNPAGLALTTGHEFPGAGTNYYHAYLMFEYWAENPEYGPLFNTRLWNDGGQPRDNYPWIAAKEVDPDPSTPFEDDYLKMVQKCITWDYKRHDEYARGAARDLGDGFPRYRTVLVPIPYQPGWYRSPKAISPLQLGYNICPLDVKGSKVVADLEGYENPARGSYWSAGFVAVQADGSPRYSAVWHEGGKSFDVRPDDKEVYLVVAATPKKIEPLGTTGDYRSDAWSQFPFRVKLDGAVPLEVLDTKKPTVPGKPHPNGGGFVADATAYIGPNAQVLGNSKVLGNARVEDQAVVYGTVKDNAVVSGHALVDHGATVQDYAKVRDRAWVKGTIKGSAKVIEHAMVSNPGVVVSDTAVIKGGANVYGGTVSGNPMIDGMYAKGNEINKGTWFTWSWAKGQNDGEIDQDFGNIYCEYTFEKEHPYLAWDTHGIVWGYLVGDPKTEVVTTRTAESRVLVLNGKDQFVDLPPDVADMRDITINLDAQWEPGAGATLLEFAAENGDYVRLSTRDEDRKLAFRIRKGDKEQVLRAPFALPATVWVNVRVKIDGDTAVILLNGKQVARDDKFILNPDDVKTTTAYLGRDTKGRFYKGRLDNFAVYSIAVKD